MRRILLRRLIVALVLGAAAPAWGQPPVTVEYYHLDGVGSVRAVTNGSGAVVRRHDYFPFGEGDGTTTGADARRFTGQQRDAETGLDYFGARYYASRTGRFTTVDPVVPIEDALVDPQRWNRYTYVMNQPLVLTDPDGRCPSCYMLLQKAAEVAQRLASSPTVQRAQQAIANQGARAWVALTQLFNTPAGQETVQTVGELITGAQAPSGRLPAISASTLETALATGAEVAGRQGTAAFRALASHIDRGDPAFQGVTKSAESAVDLIRRILTDPSRVATGQKTVDIYNAAGQGVRLEIETGKFIGFLDASKATR